MIFSGYSSQYIPSCWYITLYECFSFMVTLASLNFLVQHHRVRKWLTGLWETNGVKGRNLYCYCAVRECLIANVISSKTLSQSEAELQHSWAFRCAGMSSTFLILPASRGNAE